MVIIRWAVAMARRARTLDDGGAIARARTARASRSTSRSTPTGASPPFASPNRVSRAVSKTGADSAGPRKTHGDPPFTHNNRKSNPFQPKDERRRRVAKLRFLGFDSLACDQGYVVLISPPSIT